MADWNCEASVDGSMWEVLHEARNDPHMRTPSLSQEQKWHLVHYHHPDPEQTQQEISAFLKAIVEQQRDIHGRLILPHQRSFASFVLLVLAVTIRIITTAAVTTTHVFMVSVSSYSAIFTKIRSVLHSLVFVVLPLVMYSVILK